MAENQEKTVQPNEEKKSGIWFRYLAHPVAILFWLYAITQVFVYDLDSFLRSRFPLIVWIVKFKFPFILGIIALVWSFTKSTEILLWFLYIVLYPLILLVWTVPRFIWKQRSWNLTFAYVNTILSTTKSLKYSAITFALIIIETLLVIKSSSPPILWLAVGLSLVTVATAFVHRFTLIFKPSLLYQAHSKITAGILRFGKKTFAVEKSLKELPADTRMQTMTESQRTTWAGNLQFAIILNRGCKFISRKIEDYQRSRLSTVFYALNFIMLMAVSILMFSVINFGIYKIDPGNFNVTTKPNFFIFFFYSANTIWGHGISEVVAASTLSRVFFLAELFITFLLVVILITLWTSVRNEREADEIRQTISSIRKQGDEMALFIRDEYGFSVDDAIACLVALNMAGLIKVIEYLSREEV
ncbi:MAG: hypothetical protein ABSA33_01230 [Candidatus Micrarchaeaceae archaeon]